MATHQEIKLLLSLGHAQEIDAESGQLPLHTAILCKKYACEVLVDILEAYPSAAKIKDKLWRLPLHCALQDTPAQTEFILRLIATYPHAAMMVESCMYLPLHLAMQSFPAAPMEIVQALLREYKQAVEEETAQHFLPLHLALGARPRDYFSADAYSFGAITASDAVIETLVDVQPRTLYFEAGGSKKIFTDVHPGTRTNPCDRVECLYGIGGRARRVTIEGIEDGLHPLTIALCAGASMDTWTMLVRKLVNTVRGELSFGDVQLEYLYAQTLVSHMASMQIETQNQENICSTRAVNVQTAADSIISWLEATPTTLSEAVAATLVVARTNVAVESATGTPLAVKNVPKSVIDWGCGRTMLHWLLSFSPRPDAALVKRILQADVNAVKIRDANGMLPLHCALQGGVPATADIVTLLLDEYPDAVTERDGNGNLPVYHAVDGMCACADVVSMLLQTHARVMKACLSPSSSVSAVSMSSSDDDDAPFARGPPLLGHQGSSVSASACKGNDPPSENLAQVTPQADIGINQQETCMLDSESEVHGNFLAPNFSVLPLLLSALSYPCAPAEVVELLIQVHPQCAAQRNSDGHFPLHVALTAGAPLDLVQLLIAANPGAVDHADILHMALKSKQASLDVVKFLVHIRPQCVHMIDHAGNLPMHVAVHVPVSYQVVKFLLETCPNGARHVNKAGMLPMHMALQGTPVTYEIFELLLDSYADAVHVVSHDGRSSLHHALQGIPACLRVVEKLVQLNPGHVDRTPVNSLSGCVHVKTPYDAQSKKLDESECKKQGGGYNDRKAENGEEELNMTALQKALTGVPAPVAVVDLLVRSSSFGLADYSEHRRT